MNSSRDEPTETFFRQLLSQLVDGRGDNPDWPLALLRAFEAEFHRERQVWYSGQALFMDRDTFDHTKAVSPEKSQTRVLYNICRDEAHGCLAIEGEIYWLISFEVPCFGRRSHQCADLLGMNRHGGLVVFECKLENPYAPITATVEGLDYLSCLTSEPNFSRLQDEFETWRSKLGQILPAAFKDVQLNSSAQQEVIVLATPEYFQIYRLDPSKRRNSRRGEGWEEFARVATSASNDLRIRFAETDFSTTNANWVTQ